MDDPPDEFEDFSNDEVWESESLAAPPVLTTCWRCEKAYAATESRCPACLANNRSIASTESESRVASRGSESPAIVRVVWSFVAMAAVSIAMAISIAVTMNPADLDPNRLLAGLAVFELLHTGVVLYALYSIRPAPIPDPTFRERRMAWVLALPMLVGVLGINLAYHHALRNYLGVAAQNDPMLSPEALLPLQVILVCLQPAIVEELFFRRVALGAALEMLSPAWSMTITGLLFALAHLGQPLSLPVLGLLGIVLGYLRLTSGTLWLPMLFHFLHNLVVLMLGRAQ